jgi:hypothetical protein
MASCHGEVVFKRETIVFWSLPHTLRSSEFVQLPSSMTTLTIKSRSGFQREVDEQLVKEVDLANILEWKRYVVLLIDEMKIKENLIYDKHSDWFR